MNLKEELEQAGIELTPITESDDRIEITVVGGEHFGDNVTEIGEIESVEKLKEIIRVFHLLPQCGHIWENHNLSDEDENIVKEYVPYGIKYNNIHTIESITIILYTKTGERYNIYIY
jgi:hypothetical protein